MGEARALLVRHVRQLVIDEVDRTCEALLAFGLAVAGSDADAILIVGGAARLHVHAEEGRVQRVERDAPFLAAAEHGAHATFVADQGVEQGLLIGRFGKVAKDGQDDRK